MRSGVGAASCRLSQQVLEPVGHVAQRSIRCLQRLHARRRYFIVPLALAAALWRWVADPRLDEALLFKAIECGVDGAHGHAAAATLFNLATHGGAIGFRPKPEQCEHYDLLEFPEHGRRDVS